jgi:predicted transcriptional regulator
LKAFDLQSEKLMIHLNVKIDNDENKLKIRMAKEFDILLKKIALHEYQRGLTQKRYQANSDSE